MDSIFKDPNFEEKEYFPTDSEFERITDAFIDVKLNGEENCKFPNSPETVALVGGQNVKILSKKIIVSIILRWDALTKILKEYWEKIALIDDLKKIIGLFKESAEDYAALIDKYTSKVKSQSASKTKIDDENIDEEGIFVISAYDASYSSPARRYIRVGKKVNGIYNVRIDSADISSYDNLFLFKNKKACENFIEAIKAGATNTKRPIAAYKFTIKDKLYPQMEQDLTKYVLVNTTCGPAFICRNSQYCED